MSSQIQRERSDNYLVLEQCQRGTLDVTPWVHGYLECYRRAIGASEGILSAVLHKAGFWRAHAGGSFNERQRRVLNRVLECFEGKLTTSKWAKLAKCFQNMALRDIIQLLGRGILSKEESGGRSTSYRLVETD